MTDEYLDYSIFLKVFEKFSKSGIDGIDLNDPAMVELDRMMELNNQLFYISDLILLEIQYISRGVNTLFGVEQEKVTPGFFLTTTHPEDLRRHHLARAKLVSRAHEFYINKNGTRIVSTNFRARKPGGEYINLLYQGLLFYSKVPYESVFLIMVFTDISGFTHIHKGFHFYTGTDRQYFRYPDDKLLMSGTLFSHTEFKILELIDEGVSSKEIARKLFRSIHTITTHRSNIIKKSGKRSITEVIYDLKEKGLL